MQHPLSSSILKTLCYADVFDYPLTKEEIEKYLIWEKPELQIPSSNVTKVLERLVGEKKISLLQGYYCLKGREHTIQIRKKRQIISQEKFQKAKKIAYVLSSLPTVLLVGISGSLAMQNAKVDDDIDFFIIAKKNTVWITRLLIAFVLVYLGVRRKRLSTHAANLACVNMILDESSLSLPASFHHIYGAHEVSQLLPLVDKKGTYAKFIEENSWIKDFLPNAASVISTNLERRDLPKRFRTLFEMTVIEVSRCLEPLARFMQVLYMKSHRTSEIITPSLVAFHPVDYKQLITIEYKKRIKKYGIPENGKQKTDTR